MNADEARVFDQRIRRELGDEAAVAYVGEPKLDGAGVELVYEDGILSVGSTRGDGRVGEDVTANLRRSTSIPLSLSETLRSGSRCAARWRCRSSASRS